MPHVDIIVDDDLAVTCSRDPVLVRGGPADIDFRLNTSGEKYQPNDLEFVGFISPQDLLHREFEVTNIGRNKSGLSTMKVHDKHKENGTFRYELIFRKVPEKGEIGGDLYNYDPQIKNVP